MPLAKIQSTFIDISLEVSSDLRSEIPVSKNLRFVVIGCAAFCMRSKALLSHCDETVSHCGRSRDVAVTTTNTNRGPMQAAQPAFQGADITVHVGCRWAMRTRRAHCPATVLPT